MGCGHHTLCKNLHLTDRELRALLHAANEVEAGGFEGYPWDENPQACETLMSAIHRLRVYFGQEIR